MKKISEVLKPDEFIQDGSNPAPGVLILACTIGEDDENAKNRVLLRKGDSWLDFAVTGYPICSVDATPDGNAQVLDQGGALIRFNWRTPATRPALKATVEVLENDLAESIGPLRRVRVLGPDVMTSGTGGQVYRLVGDRFEALPRLFVKKDNDVTVKDIDGTSARDVLAVATAGYAAQFNGSKWRLLDLPSNVGLHAVCRLSDGRYAIGGRQGTVMIGSGDKWQLVDPVEGDEDGRTYYGIASDNRTIFAAYLGGIDFVDGNQLRPVKIDTRGREFVRLSRGPDGIWAMAGNTVGTVSVKDGWRGVP
jgi:hypothetical protein